MRKAVLEIGREVSVQQRFARPSTSAQVRRSGKIDFIFILAHSFSGSTLLSFLLGAHPEIATVGEMYISPEFNTAGYLCSCGEPIDQCPFWRHVSAAMAERGIPFDIRDSETSFRVDGFSRLSYRLIAAEPHGRLFEMARRAALHLVPHARKETERRLRINEALVQVVTEMRKARVFVDASKRPGRVLLLRHIPSFNLRVIHLIRDGRGVTRSAIRNLGSTAESGARSWVTSIQSAELVKREVPADCWLTLRHEDLCRNPEAELPRLFRFMGVSPDFRVQDFRSFEQHIIGNRMRLNKTSEIRLDERWKAELTPEQIRTVERIAGPELRQYGYGDL